MSAIVRTPPRRSLLFVPALRPERFDKAIHSGADLVCIDLEDSVPQAKKSEARNITIHYLRQPESETTHKFVRINTPRSLEGLKDLLALLDTGIHVDGLMIPKVSSGEEIRWISELIKISPTSLDILPIIETAQGLNQVEAIACASDRITCIAFGFVDYAAATGCDLTWDALLYARGRIISAAALRSLDTMDGPWLALSDTQGLNAEAKRVASLGFTGKMAISPRQVACLNTAFTPSSSSIEQAKRVVEASKLLEGHAFSLDGKLVDKPVIANACRVLAIAERNRLLD